MLKALLSTLRLSVRFAQLGGMAGTAVFLSQGKLQEALWCTITAVLCIVFLALAMAVFGKFGTPN